MSNLLIKLLLLLLLLGLLAGSALGTAPLVEILSQGYIKDPSKRVVFCFWVGIGISSLPFLIMAVRGYTIIKKTKLSGDMKNLADFARPYLDKGIKYSMLTTVLGFGILLLVGFFAAKDLDKRNKELKESVSGEKTSMRLVEFLENYSEDYNKNLKKAKPKLINWNMKNNSETVKGSVKDIAKLAGQEIEQSIRVDDRIRENERSKNVISAAILELASQSMILFGLTKDSPMFIIGTTFIACILLFCMGFILTRSLDLGGIAVIILRLFMKGEEMEQKKNPGKFAGQKKSIAVNNTTVDPDKLVKFKAAIKKGEGVTQAKLMNLIKIGDRQLDNYFKAIGIARKSVPKE